MQLGLGTILPTTTKTKTKMAMDSRRSKTVVYLFVIVIATGLWLYVVMNGLHKTFLSNSSSGSMDMGMGATTTTAKTGTMAMATATVTTATAAAAAELLLSSSSINSATGRLFKGEKIRTFDGERRFAGRSAGAGSSSSSSSANNKKKTYHNHIYCTQWNVVTTIFEPSEAVRRASKVEGWCTVIVADTKTPTDYMEKLRLMNGDDGDGDGNDENNRDPIVVFLSVEDQLEWIKREQKQEAPHTTATATTATATATTAVGQFLDAIPFRHFARKNIGYLYAISHGAQVIFDFDDDNLLPLSSSSSSSVVLPPLHDTQVLRHAAMVVTGPKAFNHHTLMGATVSDYSWPRGFPLSQIQNTATQGRIALEGGNRNGTYDYREFSIPREIGVMQFVADNNPDVDAIHRLVKGQHQSSNHWGGATATAPITFQRHVKYNANENNNRPAKDYYDSATKLSTMGALVVPSHAYISYNAQATIHTHKAMFALFLPFTVKGRVSDIWRAYFTQRIFRDIDTSSSTSSTSTNTDGGRDGGNGLKVVILPPDIVQDRNEHSLLADMQAEEDLYYKTEALLDFLSEWEYNDNDDHDNDNVNVNDESIPARMEKLWIDLYERDYIQLQDVTVLQLWLSALTEVGYEFPKLQPQSRRRIKDVVLMGQFNFARLAVVDEHNSQDRNDDERIKTDLLFWYQKWRQRFDNVVIRGPFPEDLANEFRTKHEIDVRPTSARLFDDKGYVSPMDNLLSTLKQYEHDPKINGVLYVHDDMLVNVTNVFFGGGDANDNDNDNDNNSIDGNRDRTRTIFETHELSGSSYRIHPPPTTTNSSTTTKGAAKMYFTKADGFRTDNSTELLNSLTPWYWDWECMHKYSQVVKDPRSRKYLEQDDAGDGNHNNNNNNDDDDGRFLTVPIGRQSDFVYIPTILTKKYEEIAQLLIDHEVFLECGFPKITDVLLGRIPSSSSPSSSSSSSSSSRQNNQIRGERKGSGETDSGDKNPDVVVELNLVDLCTSWEYTFIRGTTQMIAECKSSSETNVTKLHSPPLPSSSPYDVIHPFKLTTIGYKDWDRAFDWATAGTSRLDVDDYDH